MTASSLQHPSPDGRDPDPGKGQVVGGILLLIVVSFVLIFLGFVAGVQTALMSSPWAVLPPAAPASR